MKTYTATQLKQEISSVLNGVQTYGVVTITNRSRPDMVMMTEDDFKKLMSQRHDDSFNPIKGE